MEQKPIFKRIVAFVSCVALSVSSLLPSATLTAKLAGTGVVAVATNLVTPVAAHAQSGKRICAYGAVARGQHVGLMMEVYKWDIFTCVGAFAAAVAIWLPGSLQAMAQGMIGGQIMSLNNHGFRFRMLQTCEAFTNQSLGGHWGGNVCHSMEDYRLYGYAHAWYAAAIKKL